MNVPNHSISSLKYGIQYNFLDKPELIRITGKGHIRIVYDANGRKLQRAFIPEAGGASTITSYINGYVYQKSETITTATVPPFAITDAVVSFINFEEGRIRVITPTNQNNGQDALIVAGNLTLPIPPSGGGGAGAYDYFIMDYQQNVRLILTEETHTAFNTASMETARATLEQSIFGQVGVNNEVSATRVAKPATWTNANIGAMVSKLGTTFGKNIGPNTLQKVMAGDKVTATVQYYFQGVAGGNSTTFPTSMLGSLLQAISGGTAAASLVKNNASAITTGLNTVPGFITAIQPNGSNPVSTIPQAFLTVLFFDERFNFIAAADGDVAQQQVAASVTADGSTLVNNDIKAPKNGYAYVYISNQSNQDVFFDNLKVQVVTGNIIEENHYYSYGLKITGISSTKLGDANEGHLQNPYQYQGDYSEFDDETGWNDFELRSYDPQIGRFIQSDPYDQFPSPYTGMGNDPVNSTDPSGGFSLSAITGSTNILFNTAVTTIGGALIGGIVGMATGDDKGWLKGAAIGLGAGLAASVNWGGISNLSKIGITAKLFSATANGVKIELLYKNIKSSLTDFNWIQTIRTNDPLGGATSPYNDPQPPDDSKPFYWTDPELPIYNVAPGYDARFSDAPSRGASSTKVVKWKAELSIVGKNAKGEYQTIGTVKYGFKIKKNGTVVVRKLRTRWKSGFQKRTIKTAR